MTIRLVVVLMLFENAILQHVLDLRTVFVKVLERNRFYVSNCHFLLKTEKAHFNCCAFIMSTMFLRLKLLVGNLHTLFKQFY